MTAPAAPAEMDNGNGAFKAVTTTELAALNRRLDALERKLSEIESGQHAIDLAVARITERLSLWAGALAVLQLVLAALAAYVGRMP